MTLATLARKADGPRWQECTVHYALRSLPKPEADALLDALNNDVVAHEDIADELRRLYVRIQGGTVSRHRRGKCECDACDCGCKG
jgi:hypothetical protein